MKTIFNFIFCISAGLFLLISSCNPDSDEQNIRYGSGVTDADGNEYLSVIIGNQEWMAENLRTTKLNDSTEIPLIISDTTWASLTSPGYCLYDNNGSNKQIYGVLYNT